jgi:hypothetical protein
VSPAKPKLRFDHGLPSGIKRYYGWSEFWAWSLFWISLGLATWLAVQASQIRVFDAAIHWASHNAWPGLIPLVGFATGLGVWVISGIQNLGPPHAEWYALKIWPWPFLAGILFGAAAFALRLICRWPEELLHTTLFLMTILFLALGGIVRYWAEKLALEAEAQGAAEASPIYRRAKIALDQVDSDSAANKIDIETARRRRELIVRDLGRYALDETEAWLRSHRERPLHPAMG